MKTIKQILKQEPIFLHNWTCKIDMIGDFENIYMTSKEFFAETSPYNNVGMWECG